MTSPSHYVRLLSPFERMWLAAQSTCGLTLIEGSGKLTGEMLKPAIERASLANPGSRIQLKGFGPWARWEETNIFPAVTEVDGKGWDACSAEGAPFSVLEHMDPSQAPSASYVIIHGEQTRLVQRTHHATMDGMGSFMFLKDVFRALRNEPLVGAPSTETDLDLAKALGGRSQKLRNVCLSPFPSASNGTPGSTWHRVRVKGKIRKQPLQRTILALAAFAHRTGAGEVFIDIPVNLRSDFPALQNTGNLTGSLRLVVSPDATLESIRADISAQLAAKKQADPIVSAARLRFVPISVMRWVARSMERRAVANNSFTPTATVSNLGKLEVSEFSSPDFRADRCIIVPPAYDGVPLFLGLFGNADGIDLCARAPIALASDGRLKALLEELGQILSEPSSN